jgi:hypothetical protein
VAGFELRRGPSTDVPIGPLRYSFLQVNGMIAFVSVRPLPSPFAGSCDHFCDQVEECEGGRPYPVRQIERRAPPRPLYREAPR